MFNKKEHIERVIPYTNKLVTTLAKQGIMFKSSDGDLENVIFIKNNKELKISYHSFYRFSGICSLYKEGEDKKLEVIYITDEMYLNTFIKPIIENYFK